MKSTHSTLATRDTVLPSLVMMPGKGGPRLDDATRPRYREAGRLGVGGLGEVTLAMDEDIGRAVAIKRLRGESDEQDKMRFVDEVHIMGRLDHPNIVPVHDVGRDDRGQIYFVMKRLEGETLATIIERLRDGDLETHRQYPVAVRLEIMMSVLRALQFAYAQHTIHRDLKPANIMLGKFGEVSLVDWGIAKRLGDPISDALDVFAPPRDEIDDEPSARRPFRTRVGSLLGTPAYMSPEQARGDNPLLDERSDIFSVAVVCYELLALRHPFAEGRTSLPELLVAIRDEEPEFLTARSSWHHGAISVELANFVHRALAKQREDRYASIGEMIEALHDVLDGNFPITCPTTFMKRTIAMATRAIDTYPRVAGIGFLLVAAAVLACVVSLVLHVVR